MSRSLQFFFLLIITAFLGNSIYAQPLSGTYTIPGSYSTINDAVTALNTNGISGAVTFNVNAGHTENISTPILLTATGSALNTITFQKSGTGDNPLITRTDAGSLTTSTVGGQGDAIIIIQGGDYITFDGISVTVSQTGIEYGYFLRKASVTDGCKNITIKNAAITMTKGTSAYVCGIYSSNLDAASTVSSATGITVTSTGGRNENITFTGNTISNVFSGIYCRGYNHSTPYDFYDQNFTIGESGAGNTIQNYAGNSASTAYGVYTIYHTGTNVSYNTFNNAGGGGSNATSTLYGIFLSTSSAGGNIVVNNNNITIGQGATSGAHCIYLSPTATSFTINNNTLSYGTFASTTTSYIIYTSTATNNVTVTGNQTSGTISKTGSSGTLYGIYNAGSPTGGTQTISNNNFSNITVTGTSTLYVIYLSSSSTQITICSENTVSNLTGNTGSMYGIYSTTSTSNQVYNNSVYNLTNAGSQYGLYASGVNAEIYGNSVYNNTTSGATFYGIQNSASGTSYCFKNRIYGLASTNTNPSLYGLYVTTGTANFNYNNFISDLTAPNATGNISIAGIYASGGTLIGLYYNTVFLKAVSSSGTFGSAGVYASVTPTLDMRNNIIVNLSSPGNGGYGAKTVAFRRSALSLTTYSSNSNNNLFYAGTPDSSKVIFFDGGFTLGDQLISAYKSRVAPRDNSTVTENPTFINSTTPPYNLHVNSTIPTQIESGGAPVTTPDILVDFDADTRNITTPDIGADEFSGTGVDLSAPSIIYTALLNTSSTGARTLTSTITDPSGVPFNPDDTGLPVLYWMKNTGSWNAVTGTSIGGDIYQFVFDASVSLGDSVFYYICAQDQSPAINVGCYPSTGAGDFTSDPPAAGTPPTNPSKYYVVGSLSGIKNIPGDYASLTEAAADVNTRELTGALQLVIGAGYSATETFPITFNQPIGISAVNTVTIKPAAGASPVITGNGSAIIKLNGADYFIIDGSNSGGTSRDLSLINDSASSSVSVVWISSPNASDGATNNIIKNCIIRGSGMVSGSTYSGISFSGTSVSGAAQTSNSNNTIQNNKISMVQYGIYMYGKSVTVLDNANIITQNSLGSSTSGDGFYIRGIYSRMQDNINIERNEIQNIVSSGSNDLAGIWISDVKNANVSRNSVHNISYTGISTSYQVFGITSGSSNFNTSGNPTSNIISNNLIYDVISSGKSTTWNVSGINNNGGYGDKYYYNSVYLTGQLSTAAGGSSCFSNGNGSTTTTSDVLDIRNNIFYINGTSTAAAPLYAHYTKRTSYTGSTLNNNILLSAASGSATAAIGYLNSIPYTILAEWKTNSGEGTATLSSNPLFISEYNLRIDNSSPAIAGGTPISVLVDYTGASRNVTTPSIGAYESGVNGGPSISYTSLTNTYVTGNVSLANVTITDADGVASGLLLPKIYWKVNSGSWNSAASSGGSSPYSFSIGTTGLSIGDIVYYFVIAQDALGNVAAQPGAGLVAADVNTVTTHPSNASSYTIIANPNYGGGGASTGGYYFANSTSGAGGSPSQPVYAWIDPVAEGHTAITTYTSGSEDDGYFTVPDIGFDFTYFGTVYRTSNVFIGTNGYVSFGTGYTVGAGSVTIPSSTTPNSMIAGCMMDLEVTAVDYPNAKIYYGGNSERFVITYWHAYDYISTPPAPDYITFQIILYSNGIIKIQYNDSESSTFAGSQFASDAVVGIENTGGTLGVSYRSNGTGGDMFGSPLAVAFGIDQSILPVELSAFTAKVNNRNVVLNWETKTEVNASAFIVERSSDNKSWITSGSINAAGNSNNVIKYSYTDKKLNTGKYSYRLKLVDADGSFEYSDIVTAEIGLPTEFALSQNYPNPFNPSTRIDYQLPVDSRVSLQLFAVTGELVAELVNSEQSAGYYIIDVNSSKIGKDLASGVYIYRISAVNKLNGNNFISIKKMMMLK